MSKIVTRLSQLPIGATFKYLNKLYVKTLNSSSIYQPNAIKLENDKPIHLHGATLVEVIKDE